MGWESPVTPNTTSALPTGSSPQRGPRASFGQAEQHRKQQRKPWLGCSLCCAVIPRAAFPQGCGWVPAATTSPRSLLCHQPTSEPQQWGKPNLSGQPLGGETPQNLLQGQTGTLSASGGASSTCPHQGGRDRGWVGSTACAQPGSWGRQCLAETECWL